MISKPDSKLYSSFTEPELETAKLSFTAEIFRASDMLNLRFSFFNAKVEGGKLMPNAARPLFVYVQLPSQHVAEELLGGTPANRDDFKRKASFVSKPSYLALRMTQKTIEYKVESLLDWKNNFRLVTLNDFSDEKGDFERFGEVLFRLKEAHTNGELLPGMSFHHATLHTYNWFLPLTKLEVPYKMVLSPLAPPAQNVNDVVRQKGVFGFDGDNLEKVEFPGDAFRIVRPWQTELVFTNYLGQKSAPRFKVVTWRCQDVDVDEKTKLLPAPINREELHELTMEAEGSRDVISERMILSSLGATANLKYKNDNPLAFALVAWQQKVRHARDNYVSVTFRAIDTFTGIKLLISIVVDRRYKKGISFLPELYHVAFAEKEKTYDTPIVVSKIPFVKVSPVSDGNYFLPVIVPGTSTSYFVTSKTTDDGIEPGCDQHLTFDYIGVDKQGKEHAFQSKIIFILAERYTITSGVFNAYNNDGTMGPDRRAVVPITEIGWLNPLWRDGNERKAPCSDATPPQKKYTYKIEKNFGKKNNLAETLKILREYVLKNRNCFKIDINNEVTYTRIEGLQQKSETREKGKLTELGPVRLDARNATYDTRDLLLFTSVNETLFPAPDSPDKDGFLDPHPLVAYLHDANVLVSQINQMAGQNLYTKVKFSDAYFSGGVEIDQENPKNRAKLLFKVDDSALRDFFSNNYRRAGAMVNPGIEVSHISVLEQSIAYNESHNEDKQFFYGENKLIPTSSIFRGLDAEILGIPLKVIVNEFLPIEDLPVFNYLQQAQNTFDNLTAVPAKYITKVQEWSRAYWKYKQQLESAINELEGLKSSSPFKENSVRAWLESVIRSAVSLEFFEDLEKTLSEGKKEYGAFVENVLKSFRKKLQDRYLVDIDAVMKGILLDENERLNNLFQKVAAGIQKDLAEKINPVADKVFKEAYRYYFISEFAKGRYQEISEKLKKRLDDTTQVAEAYLSYHKAFLDAYYDASHYTLQFVQQQREALAEYLSDGREYVQTYIESELNRHFGKFYKEFYNGLLLINQLSELYGQFYRMYNNLQRGHYEKLMREAGLTFPTTTFDDVEKLIVARFRKSLEKFGERIRVADMSANLKAAVGRLKVAIDDILAEADFRFADYEEKYKEQIQEVLDRELAFYYQRIAQLDEKYQEYLKRFNELKNTIANLDVIVKEFIHEKVKWLRNEIEEEKKKLIRQGIDSPAYVLGQELIAQIEAMISLLKGVHKQKLNYDYTTNKFKKATVGVIQFQPKNTSLTVNVEYGADLAYDVLSGRAKIARQYYSTSSTLTDFKLGLMSLLYVDFEKVEFVSGSEIKDDFKVNIRDVQFAGCLSFVQAFQQYLSTVNDNLIFNIDSRAATIGYAFAIPDFPAGYFNFFNLSLTGLLTLPFDPKQALQLKFGIGSELNKFGLTVSGIFGGQGYFNIIAEPKRGIVGLELCMEFGAIFNLNVGPARGTAYLVGGIYIKRLDGNYQMKAYILCVGRFNIISLFSASITFYMGLEGNGHVLKGRCSVKVTKHFTRYYKVSVWCGMEKTIEGAKSERRQKQGQLLTSTAIISDPSLIIEDSNLDRDIYYGEGPFYIIIGSTGDVTLEADIIGGGNRISVQPKKWVGPNKIGSLNLVEFNLDKNRADDYELVIRRDNNTVLSKRFTVMATPGENCETPAPIAPSAREYFGSYYY